MDQRAKSLIIWQNHSLVVGTPMYQSCCDFLPTLQTVMEFFEPKNYTTASGGKSKQRHLCMVEPVNVIKLSWPPAEIIMHVKNVFTDASQTQKALAC